MICFRTTPWELPAREDPAWSTSCGADAWCERLRRFQAPQEPSSLPPPASRLEPWSKQVKLEPPKNACSGFMNAFSKLCCEWNSCKLTFGLWDSIWFVCQLLPIPIPESSQIEVQSPFDSTIQEAEKGGVSHLAHLGPS